jgi:predicted TPR repeat methyltransferase
VTHRPDEQGNTSTAEHFDIIFPASRGADHDQDEEWCELSIDGETRRIRFHDYDQIFAIPGLYEQLFYEELKCVSPRTVRELLAEQLEADDREPSELSVLDVGAGNGMVGEELAGLGVSEITGIDIIEEAAEATERDRPGVYDDYFVADLTDLPPDARSALTERHLNCLTTVAALGFGDIPPEAFAQAHDLVADGGLIVFNIKEDFVALGEGSGFSRLIRRALDDGTLVLERQRRYRHRLSVAGDPLYYVAMVARKTRDLGPQ